MLKRILRRSGQATIEYILLLTVFAMIGLGSLYQFNDAFRVFATSYFGDYLACLLETGELPFSEGGECDASYRAFNLADGKALAGGSGNSGGVSTGTDPSGSSNKNSSPSKTKSSAKGSDDSGGRSRIVGSGASRSSGSPFRGAGSSGSGGGRTVVLNKMDKKGESSGRTRQVSSGGQITTIEDTEFEQGGRTAYVPVTGDDAAERDQRLNKKGKVPVTENDKQGRGRTVSGGAEKAKGKDVAIPDAGLTLPNFIRFLLIAGIIIAIVFFLGGQALQISKSQDK